MAKKKNLTREEVAQAEVGTTEVSTAVKWFLAIAFICTIIAVPLVQCLLDGGTPPPFSSLAGMFADSELDRDLEKLKVSQSGIRYPVGITQLLNEKSQENFRKFESSLEEESWVLKKVGPTVEKVMIGGLGSGSRDVYCGRDGWLFFRPTFDYLTSPPFLDGDAMKRREGVQPDPVQAIVNFRDQLARRGIELVVLPSPAKATVYPERFSSRYSGRSAALQNPSFPEFVRRLQATGVRVFDPTPLLMQAKGKEDVFLKTDTHWAPAGAELVARQLAAYLEKNSLLPAHPGARYQRGVAYAKNAGDLARMLKGAESDGYPKERVELHPVRQGDGTPFAPSRDADLLVLGDSYANIFSLDGMGWGTGSGLVEQLGFYLNRPVDSIVINDKGSFSTRQQLGNELRRGQDRLAGKRVVIYEFATRELALGDWKRIDLTLGKRADKMAAAPGGTPSAATAAAAAKAAPEGLRVEGVIEEITRPPQPGSTAYKDAVIAMHLKQVTSGGKPFGRSQIVVFAWGMRDDVATPATRYRRGDRVTLQLRPWSEVERKYGSYQRIELQNDDTVFLDIFWLAQPGEGNAPAPAAKQAPAGTASVAGSKSAPNLAPASASAAAEKKAAPNVAAKPQAIPGNQPQAKGEMKQLFQKRVLELTGAREEGRSVAGAEGWLFSRQELNHLAKGEFWGDAAQTTSVATKPENRDPLAAILDFKQQLDRAGIELIVVPVPAKAHVYPDKLVEGIAPEQAVPGSRLDLLQRQFLGILEKAGVDCLDLTPLFLKARKNGAQPLFLQKDTHWSPIGIALVAQALKEKIAQRPWYQALPKQQFSKSQESVQLKGDLVEGATGAAAGTETVRLSKIQQRMDGTEGSPLPDRNSPIVLLGDSHTLIFHSGGDMYAKDAGLPEQLAYELGLNVDLVGVRGSGATPARVELARRRDNMAGKKLVIWCFTVREFTESQTGWRKVPVIR